MVHDIDEYMTHKRKSMTYEDIVAYAEDMRESILESKKEGMMTVGQAEKLEELEKFLYGWLGDNRSPVGPKVCEDCEENEVRE